jgi:hypothetical protein
LPDVFPGGRIDAVEGRQPAPILADARAAAARGRLHPLVVLHLGNNGRIVPADLRQTLQALSAARLVVVVNDHIDPADRLWQKPNNATFAAVVPEFPNARLLDWDTIAGQHRSWLYADDIHLEPAGAVGYANLLASTYRQAVVSGVTGRSYGAR